ncbi:MAG TPA: MogA/MoaB family molybdenum cofactor biosynthesis protein [Terracidiphilus sp.]|jgi:molybdenum cofactor synthesis domain-containing protein
MLLCVLTVSDRCSQGLMIDTAGPAVIELLRQHWPEARLATALVPDNEDEITARMLEWTSMGANLVLSVGGTGLSPRDRTPEATLHVIERYVPGLAEAMRALGSEKNIYAWLSRGIAGMRGNTLLVNLPGSKRGAVESLESILILLRHAMEIASGGQNHPQ